MLASWPFPPHSYCPYNQGDLSSPLDLPPTLSSLIDNPGHVQSATTSLCSGLFQMPLDIFFLLFIINKTYFSNHSIEQPFQWFLHCAPHISTKLEIFYLLTLYLIVNVQGKWQGCGLTRAFNIGSMISRDFLPPIITLGLFMCICFHNYKIRMLGTAPRFPWWNIGELLRIRGFVCKEKTKTKTRRLKLKYSYIIFCHI